MADTDQKTDGPTPFATGAYQIENLPDWDNDFIADEDIVEFARALAAPENSPSNEDVSVARPSRNLFITALNDWRPIHQRVRKRKKRPPRRGKDETREGFVYNLLKWPLLLTVLGWLGFLGFSYLLTRLYIYLYEQWVTWRGRREQLRKKLQNTKSYQNWIEAAKELDNHLGNDKWKKTDDYAYYDSKTICRVRDHMQKLRQQAEIEEMGLGVACGAKEQRAVDELRGLVEACVKNNFAGIENSRLYSETYYGTKDLVQSFVDEAETSLSFLQRTAQLGHDSKRSMFRHIHNNLGRTALCLSGGATFAYYHFGVSKALLDANLLPQVITGTSGGALVAGLLGTRTDEELKQLLVPALAHRITACHDGFATWVPRWWRTGARFDSIDWASRCAWFTRGSMTFREAFERTGRILNVTCVPSDPHSPTILANYLTSPDCVIWSAVLASAAVPGILNPVVLMKKNKDGTLAPFSFGHKWKDGSLRTDIPLKSLHLHFNICFSIVSQVNPHINLFFFSSRGTVGRPVTHRKGRGWRGGFLGSATEQYLKLDLTKWLKVLRHLELLPRPLGQDWSEIWLQRFSGTITIWPKSIPSDFRYILSDPTPDRLARMIHVGQQGTFPKLKFIANRIKLERAVQAGRRATRANTTELTHVLSEDDLEGLLREARKNSGRVEGSWPLSGAESSSGESSALNTLRGPGVKGTKKKPMPRSETKNQGKIRDTPPEVHSSAGEKAPPSPALSERFSNWWASVAKPKARRSPRSPYLTTPSDRPASMFELRDPRKETIEQLYARAAEAQSSRRGSWLDEATLQTRVFADDSDTDDKDVSTKKSQQRKKTEGGSPKASKVRETADDYESVDEMESVDGLEEDGTIEGSISKEEDERIREKRALQKYLGDDSESDEDVIDEPSVGGTVIG